MRMDLGNRAENIMDARVAVVDKHEPAEQRYNELKKYAL